MGAMEQYLTREKLSAQAVTTALLRTAAGDRSGDQEVKEAVPVYLCPGPPRPCHNPLILVYGELKPTN